MAALIETVPVDTSSGTPQAEGEKVEVWFRLNQTIGEPIPVEAEPNAIVFEAMKTALTDMQQKTPPHLVVVRYEGQKIDTGELVKDELDKGHGSTSAKCFVLELLQLEGEPPSKKRRTAVDRRSDNLERFYKALKTAKVHADHFLKLPNDVSFLCSIWLPSKLYVRQAYVDLHKLIHVTYSSRNAFLVTGNPGVGKSFFALYELYYLLKETVGNKSDAAIVYESVPFEVSLVLRANSMEVLEYGKRPLEMPKGTTYYLFDAGSKGSVFPAIENAKTIVFSAPSITNYQDWKKHCSPKTFYMPVWSLEELQVVLPERTKDIERLYLVCGGIPRYVIQDLKKNPTQDIEAAVAKEQRAIQSVVGNLTLEAIKTMANELENCTWCTIPDSTSHRLLQIRLHEDEDGKLDYEEPHVYFASEFIQEKVFNRFQSPQAYTGIHNQALKNPKVENVEQWVLRMNL